MIQPDPTAATSPALPVKIVVAGGFGVGKSTFVGAISDIDPLTTEAAMTSTSQDVDYLGDRTTKRSTTVAMDFGRVGLGQDLILYLFGTPGQDRFQFMWDELVRGAIGAVVLVDTTRLEQCFASLSFMERAGIPFIVAVNAFDGLLQHRLEEVRSALDIPDAVPMVVTDARNAAAVRDTLVQLVSHSLRVAGASQPVEV